MRRPNIPRMRRHRQRTDRPGVTCPQCRDLDRRIAAAEPFTTARAVAAFDALGHHVRDHTTT